MINAERLLTEMAVMKMPDGSKRARSKEYSGVHNVHVDGEHAGTIIGHTNRDRGAPHGSKYYEVHSSEEAAVKWPTPHADIKSGKHGHPLHQEPVKHAYYDSHKKEYGSVEGYGPKKYGSMDEAIHHVVSAHRNQKEFGAGHNKEDRWAHAVSHIGTLKAHKDIENHHEQAIRSLSAAGHHDLAKTVSDRLDAHKAANAGGAVSKAKMKQWLHDAHHHASGAEFGRYNNENPHSAAANTALKAAAVASVHSPHLPWS